MHCSYCSTSNRGEDKFCRKCGKSTQINKNTSEVSNLKVGWMMWWRAFLPGLVLSGFFMFAENIVWLIIIFPLLLFLLDWAGKTVARKKYNLIATSIKIYVIPIPLITALVSLSSIGVNIWWRMILFNILLIPLPFVSSFLFSILPNSAFLGLLVLFLGFVSLGTFFFLQVLILGWVTNRVIQELCESEKC